ncbi:putative porin [Lutibacter holmesii]|uniref:Porin n=1 Tax=Lutibacter holmesii TaxID=1137985 RepID=A0ABW3WJT8_9FLAO
MRKVLFIVLFGLVFINLNAQISRTGNSNGLYQLDSTNTTRSVNVKIEGKTTYTDYKVISLKNDTTYIDTTLSIKKEYKHNFIRKDNYDYVAFHNQGQTFNRIVYDFTDNSIFPAMGFNAKQRNYFTLNDVKYYHVPTPTTELMYRKGIEQGQVVDALLTANTSRRFNISTSYKGLRSTGEYRNALSSQRNFRTTFNYSTKNKRYFVRGHLYNFYFSNQENGGLTDESIEYFETNDSNYIQRSRLEVNFTDAESVFEGKRYYLDQNYALFSNRIPKKQKSKLPLVKPIKLDSIQMDSLQRASQINIAKNIQKDSTSITAVTTAVVDSLAIQAIKKDSAVIAKELKPYLDFKLGNTLMYETKHHRFFQDDDNSYFGDAFVDEISDHSSFQQFNGQLYAQLNSAYIGSLKVKANYFNYNYHYNGILYYDDYTVSDKIKGNAVSFGADWYKKFGNIHLNADASTIVLGNITGNTIKSSVMYKNDTLFNVKGYVEFTSKTPDFNKQLFQSGYENYNWENNFKNEVITSIGGAFNSEKWVTLQGDYNIIDNYTYFNEDGTPAQTTETLTYFKIKLIKAINFRKFTLDNTVTYQDVTDGDSFFRVPKWVTRNTLYYSTYMFKGKPLYMQTGVTFRYFSKFKMNAYNPLIGEFTLQNTYDVGDYPVFDFFVNLQVSRLRMFFKLENFSASFTGRNYYSAPTYPYRDLTFRLGVVWNFFI